MKKKIHGKLNYRSCHFIKLGKIQAENEQKLLLILILA